LPRNRNGPSEIPRPRCLASIIRLPQLDHADRDSGHCAVDGDHGDAKHDLQHPDISLRRVSEASGTGGTTIGILFSAAEIASGFGALFSGRAMRLGDAQRTMLSGTALSILLIAMTPLLGDILALLLLSQVIRGWLEGVIQPLVLSVRRGQSAAISRAQS